MSPRPRDAGDPTLPLALARAIAFVPLAGFAALQWMALVEPRVPGRAGLALLVAAAAIVALLAAARLPGRARHGAAILVLLAGLALALLVGGVPATLLRPSHWGELAAGISRGIAALPGVRLPYRGLDGWIRLVMPLGGTALVVVAAVVSFWPRGERLGRPLPALLLLVVLYAVPTVTLDLGAEFLSGAVFSVFVLAFLRLERLRLRDARLAGALAGFAIVVGMGLAPLMDERTPWFDYEAWALDASTAKTTTYSWDHSYGPLKWPRDGREMLRVRAHRPAYWKAENLTDFDGLRWVHGEDDSTPQPSVPGEPDAIRRWSETVRVTVEGLRTPEFITAGYGFGVHIPGEIPEEQPDGTYTSGRVLERGDTYTAAVYSPQPTERERHAAPVLDDAPVWADLRLRLPEPASFGVPPSSDLISFPRYGSRGVPRAALDGSVNGDAVLAREDLRHGPYAGVWRIARRLERGTSDQEDIVARVLRFLAQPSFTYTESPPPAARDLVGFLTDARSGYCQQYSGAMAMLLRMDGIPARVATGFTSGALDREANEYVVRDLDAHSWVEVWYAGIGWVTFDPTPASAPPRAQPHEAGTPGGPSSRTRVGLLPGDKAGTRASIAAPLDSRAPWWQTPLIVVVVLLALAAAAWAWRRARRGAGDAVSELALALARTHRGGGPGTTLSALEAAFAGSPAAAGYVRALRDARYSARPAAPTRSQRRALRAELGRGAGLGGHLRAWWALPPL